MCNTKRSLLFILLLLFSLAVYAGNSRETPDGKIYIAISKGSGSEHYTKYAPWLKDIDTNICIIDLYSLPLQTAIDTLTHCSGLLLSGGPDVHPGRYGNPKDSSRCYYIDHYRDTLEFAVIKQAQKLKLPILGICRGLQILNVAFGGTLIVDIPSDYKTNILHMPPDTNTTVVTHKVKVKNGSRLQRVTKIKEGVVNSYHHQAIKRLAKRFKVSAVAEDGIIEAIEWKNPKGKPFLMAVQWHPERLEPGYSLSKLLGEEFIKSVKLYRRKK